MTRLGDFCMFIVTNFRTKVAQILNDYFGLFEKHQFFSKTFISTFWQLLENFGHLFIPVSSHTVCSNEVQIFLLGMCSLMGEAGEQASQPAS